MVAGAGKFEGVWRNGLHKVCTLEERSTTGRFFTPGRCIFLPALTLLLTAGCLYARTAVMQSAASLRFLNSSGMVIRLANHNKTPSLKQLIASVSAGLRSSAFQRIPAYRPTGWRYRLSVDDSAGTSPIESAPQARKKKKQQFAGSPRHIFWVVPAFNVDYANNFHPLTPKEKFLEWARGAYDPLGLAAGAFEAGTEYSPTSGFCDYGQGWSGYGECFGSAELDANVSSFFGDFVFTVLMHQDPRYFRLGHGSFGRRLWYAISRVWLTHSDSGHIVFYSSALSGTVLAAAVSNLYYPQQERGFSLTLSRIGWDLGDTALYNAAAEFWPDIKQRLYHTF